MAVLLMEYPTFFLACYIGSTITAEIQGVIDACVKLTGMPDLTLSFMVRSWSSGLSLSFGRVRQDYRHNLIRIR